MCRTAKEIAKNIFPSTIPTKSEIFVSDFEGFFQSLYGCIKTNGFDMQNLQGDNRKIQGIIFV